jgi:uncharacterized iron-regulated membrane protein
MRKLLFNLHLYGALVVGTFVVIVGLTGSIIAFEEDLDHLFNPALFHVQVQGERMPPSALLKAASAAYPGQRIGAIRLPQAPDDSAVFTVPGPRQVFMNPYTGAIVGSRDPKTLLSSIHMLHLRLLMGPVGGTIVAAVTAVLMFLVLSGIYLWWPLKRVTIRWKASLRRVHFDLHNTAGIYSALFLLVLGATGIVIHFDDDLEQYLHRTAGTKKIVKNFPSVVRAGANSISPDDALGIGLNFLPGTKALSVSVPPGPKGSYLVALRYPEDLTPGGRTWVNVDRYSGQVLGFQSSRTVAWGTRTIIYNRAIHTGDIWGYWSKILMSLSSMMLVIQAITGYYLWWKKLRVRELQAENQPAAETVA